MLAVVPGTASATAQSTSIQILSQAQLLQPSGIVLVTVYYSCGPAALSAGTINVGVEQPTGKYGSSGGQTAICDDTKHKLTAEVKPGSLTGFAPGSASAVVNLSNAGLSHQTAQAEITIK
jgi:hypothetical protein